MLQQGVLAAAYHELRLLGVGKNHIDASASSFVSVETLQHQEVALGLLHLGQVVPVALRPHLEGKSLFADAALELLPVVPREVNCAFKPFLFLLPVLQATQVNESVVSLALTGLDQGVFDSSFILPTELALDISQPFFLGKLNYFFSALQSFYFHELLKDVVR